MRLTYGSAIREGFRHLLAGYPDVFVMGQGLWSPWYVGASMSDLEVEFGKERVIDTPVSEAGTTGVAVGAAVSGMRPIVVHPRMDFMLLAVDPIVTQAAKWSSMFGGRARAPVVFRAIINRGGEQGAQHSQAMHAWFAHTPGLRVVMPATVADARDLLVSATLCDDPVLYIDDRWLYHLEDDIDPEPDGEAIHRGPEVLRAGSDLTIVGAGHTVALAREAAAELEGEGVSVEVVDLRVLNPLDAGPILDSVRRTGRLLVVDAGWRTCGLAGEIVARVVEGLEPSELRSSPRRVTLQHAPAPTSGPLEHAYYPTTQTIVAAAGDVLASHPAESFLDR